MIMGEFGFGKNWQSFSKAALTKEKARQSETKHGQLLALKRAGADVVGNDMILLYCLGIKSTARYFPEVDVAECLSRRFDELHLNPHSVQGTKGSCAKPTFTKSVGRTGAI